MWLRTTVAFVVAPAIGALAASLVLAAVGAMWSAYLFILFSTVVVSYAITVVVGVPWFLVWPRLPTSIWGFALAGVFVACVAAVLMMFFLPPLIALSSVLAGAAAGAAFGVIMLPTSNNRWRGP
jgi:hypothetical protein